MNRITKKITAALMALVMMAVMPLANMAPKAAAEGKPLYISEFKVGMGETEEEAKKELEAEGYTILKDDNGNYADLNVDAGSKSALKEGANDKIVYLGYKTTDDPKDAVTDLAVMNMKNEGYSLEDYNMLIEQQMESQIKPFVDSFIATLNEYRENLKKSKTSKNYIRADYMRRSLNRFTDDDTGGKPMGDLLLNKTKYELGDAEYDKLSDAEKKDHCDILTLLMQANGQAALALKKLVSRASDTSKNTWIDRFRATTLDDLINKVEAEDPSLTSRTDIMAALDRKYQDSAITLLNKWTEFRDMIVQYEETAEDLIDTIDDTKEELEELEELTVDNVTDEKLEHEREVVVEMTSQMYDTQVVVVGAYLETTEYDGETLYDFFTREYDEVSTDTGIRTLYPIVASLSAGQEAGLDFLSIMELFSMALADKNSYKGVEASLEKLDTASVYAGVNRELYEKGGVALTSDALRGKALNNDQGREYKLGTLPAVFWGMTAGFAAATVAGSVVTNMLNKTASAAEASLKAATEAAEKATNALLANQQATLNTINEQIASKQVLFKQLWDSGDRMGARAVAAEVGKLSRETSNITNNSTVTVDRSIEKAASSARHSANIAKYLSIGLAVITVIVTVVSTILTILDVKKFYDIDFAPIPKYIVDEADITTVNEKGQIVMLKDETAYYRVVECNRTAGDSKVTQRNFKAMGTRSDLNGDIGQEWLALYAVKYLGGTPILADSLIYRLDDNKVPEGYTTGIHMFGSTAATNLNNKHFLFRENPPSIKVFFKTDTSTVSQLTGAASIFSTGSGGSLALGGGVGLILGVLLGALVAGRRKKKIA